MATRYLGSPVMDGRERSGFVIPIVILWAVVAAAVLTYIWVDNEMSKLMPELYLLPWTILAGICVLAPSAYLYYKGKFDLFHPLVFAAWSHVFPAYVLGGVIVAFGWVNTYFLMFIDDAEYNLPLTQFYITIGFVGLTVGYFLPVGRKMAEVLEPRWPNWNWKPEQVWLPGLMLLFAGVAFNVIGFVQGLLGFQRNVDVGIFDGTLFALMTILGEGTLLLWLAIFSTKERRPIFYLVLGILIAFIPIRMAVQGSRSSLILSLIPIAMAFLYSGRRLKMRTMAAFGVIGFAALLIGTMYGTTFRNTKGTESSMDATEYFSHAAAAVDEILTKDPFVTLESTAEALAQRVENLSLVAVTVANYEKLAPYEASYGLDNNIMKDIYTAFIPRFIWTDKPPISDPRAYGALYFNFGENSFTISPFGDLLRNFGPFGVPLGMMVMGIYLRLIYASLIETPNPAMWKKVAFYPLLTIVSYEGFFATVFPSVVRLVFILGVSLFVVNLFVFSKRRNG